MSFDSHDNTSTWIYLEELIVQEVGITSSSLMLEYPLNLGTEYWGRPPAGTGFDSAQSFWEPSHLGLNPMGSLSCFDFWYSPAFQVEEGFVYRAVYQAGSSVTSPDKAVQMMLRVNQCGSWQAWDRTVTSNLNQALMQGDPRTYEVFFAPRILWPEDDLCECAFDIMSFDYMDDAFSSVFLEGLTVDQVIINP
jgi:hypothetical protein